VREVRNQKNIKPKEPLPLFGLVKDAKHYTRFKDLVQKLAFLSSFEFTDKEVEGAQTFLVGTDTFFVEVGDTLDPEQERARLLQEQNYLQGFVKSVEGKLSNERFVSNAPDAVVAAERKKLEDGQAKLKAIAESLSRLN
jgi:valyl-tRNA synthetase